MFIHCKCSVSTVRSLYHFNSWSSVASVQVITVFVICCFLHSSLQGTSVSNYCFTCNLYAQLQLHRRCRQLNVSVNMMAFYLVLLASHNPPWIVQHTAREEKGSRGGGVSILELVSVHLLYIRYWNMFSITYFRAITCAKMILIHSENILSGDATYDDLKNLKSKDLQM